MTRGALIDMAAFNAVWLIAAFGAAAGRTLPGLVAAAIAIALHLARPQQRRTRAMAIAACGLAGLIAESVLAGTGLVRFAAPWPIAGLAPAWIVALWLAFGTTLEVTGRMLGQRPLLAAALGAIFGPLAYLAGAKLGALELPEPSLRGLMAIGIVWAIAYPLLIGLYQSIAQREPITGSPPPPP